VADPGESWTTQQLVEFLAVVSSFPDEQSAISGAVERAAEALEAEVGAVVRDGRLLASTGFPAHDVPIGPLVAAAEGTSKTLEVPGAGVCTVISVSLEDDHRGRLMLARGAGETFDRQEANLVRGMARVLTLALHALRLIGDERALRERSEEQALENARLLSRLQERQALLERLSRIQRSIVQRAKLADVLDAIVDGAGELLGLDATGLRLLDPQDEDWTVLVACRGMDAEQFPIGSRLPVRDGASGRSMTKEGLVIIERGECDEDAREGLERRGLKSAMATPVVENGRVVGALSTGSRAPDHEYTAVEQEVLLALAELASLALTDAKNYDEALHRAFHDMLTGLPNRALFLDRLEHVTTKATRAGWKPAVLFLDLDGFKRVNDSLGHAAGDQLLVDVAQRLRECVRAGDTAARFGGDEFAILLEGIRGDRDAVIAAERVMSSLHAPFRIQDKDVSISVSIGIAILHNTGDDLVRNADLAMYHAKGRGKGQHEVFDPAMHAALVERLRLETDLARAVDRREFELAYQPIIELGTGAVVAVEALVRWRHPSRGQLLPAAFIPAAEETGMIRAIGRQVLEEACLQGAAWQRRDPVAPPLAVSVNLSVTQLQHAAELVADVERALQSSGLDPACLILEITETLLLHDLERGALARLKQVGVRIAVDDFGTGYSSLQYLRHFPIDILKIDKSFVDGIADPNEPALAQAIIDVGASLNLCVIAEGIEREEQAARLIELGCLLGQGYHYARPRAPQELESLLLSRGIVGWDSAAAAGGAARTAERRAARRHVSV
jgi:diguanylate cyclase (GGDEF)-like protein